MAVIKNLELKAKATPSNFEKTKIKSGKDAYDVIRKFYHDDIIIYESFFLLLLDRQNNTIAYVKISQGGVAGTVVDPKIIAKYAIDVLASGVILAHNHPSGSLVPSHQDISITNRIKEGLGLLDVNVLDHIILTENSYCSFQENGLI